ncbi:MAG: PSD1 and planctomycete cytochrome C domain-containing protein [Acidobacteria bacterium]|nr:PSD1 and planctomycete cytochrome C domain-containing protein [Acidobacteriota bacterium]
MRLCLFAFFWIACLLSLPLPAALQGEDPVGAFRTQVKPILEQNCFSCHTDTAMGGLRIDSREHLLKGGNSGPAVVPGRPAESILYQAITHTHTSLKMPPQGKLAPDQIAALRVWIESGVHFDTVGRVKELTRTDVEEQKKFWAFQPVRKSAPPAVRDSGWVKNDIDRFILAKLEIRGLHPIGAADKRTLLRRATYDLTGLPPTPEEMQTFLADKSQNAWEKVINRLLASPRYGERWGRFWLDVARYSDEDALGLSADPFPNAWRYRDWVIQAMNDDMTYDVFVKAQIAGDFLDKPGENRYRLGLGLFGLGPWYYKLVDPPKARADERHDRIDVLTRGFLGLTVACARCHDHKYDPIPTRDYYALAGVFASTELKEEPLAPKDVVAKWHDKQKQIENLEADLKKRLEQERKRLGRMLARDAGKYLFTAWRIERGNKLPRDVAADRLNTETLDRWVAYLRGKYWAHPYLTKFSGASNPTTAQVNSEKFQRFLDSVATEYDVIQEYNKRVLEEAEKSTDPYDIFCKGCNAETKTLAREKYMLWTDMFGAKQQTHEKNPGLFYYADDQIDRRLSDTARAQIARLRDEVKQRKSELPPRYPFLHVIADSNRPADSPLHVRGDPYHLGPLVPRGYLSVLSKSEPAHFEHGSGRLKLAELIASADNPLTARVIVNRVWYHHLGTGLVRSLSNFGQVGDRPSHPELLDYLAARLIENQWSLKRLHREILLSATYGLSGEFRQVNFNADPENRLLWRANRRRLDIESLRDSLLFVAGTLDTRAGGPPEDWKVSKRRSVYGRISRFRLERTLSLFDFPDPTISAEQRASTNTPLQRLFFLNSDLVHDMAKSLAARIEATARSDPERIDFAYILLFGRQPDDEERHMAAEYLTGGGTWREYAHVLMSTNEFQFLD